MDIPELSDEEFERSDGSCPTSRCSTKLVFKVISSFDDFKRKIVTEMGFEGLLKFPLLNKLNLKFSVWLLSKIDEIRRMIIIDESRQYKMSPKDVKNVFGIPCSGRRVLEKISDGKQGIVYLIRKCLGMEKKDGHSLKAAQKILEKQYRNPMSQEEIKVFKTAFIIFIVGHLLAPTSKHDYGTFAYWHALENTDDLQCWNWGEFVLDALCQAATRIKNELSNGSNISYITGCTLFFQVRVNNAIHITFFFRTDSSVRLTNTCFFRFSIWTMPPLDR